MPRKRQIGQNEVAITKGGIEAVDRAMKVLSVYTRRNGELSLHELAEQTGFYKSTLLRILASLEAARMLQRLPDKKYALGQEVMRLSAIFQHTFRFADSVRPILKHLVQITGESSSFFRTQGNSRICLVRENSPHSIRDHAMEGDILPLNKGAAGRVLAEFREIKSDSIPGKLVRALPYLSYGEVERDMAGLAVPVFSSDNSLAGALAVSGPTSRFTSSAVGKYKPLILKAAQSLSEVLGADTSTIGSGKFPHTKAK